MAATGITGTPLTIVEWKAAQAGTGGLERVLAVVKTEREDNWKTHAWITLADPEHIRSQWDKLPSRAADLPLRGVPFAVKDNIDAEGFVTTAACPAFSNTAAVADAPVVARLKAAGAILIGKTNLDQFASGLVGTRSPYGTVPNALNPEYVSGGSSSGSAVVVSRGAVPFAIGTDTAGSIRVPAGLNNVVGLKPTRGALSARGGLPACKTLDCVSILALTVDDAATVLSITEGFDIEDEYSRSRPGSTLPSPMPTFGCANLADHPSIAICAEPKWFDDRIDHNTAYESALEKARDRGWKLTPIDFEDLFALGELLYGGPWVAERYEAIRDFIEECDEDDMDPVVRQILLKAKNYTAADAFRAEYQRQKLTRRIQLSLKDYDAILVPATPTIPAIKQIAESPVVENARLATYTNFVNFMDWTSLAIPAGFRRDGLPFGLCLIANQWQEPTLLELARRWYAGEPRTLGATGATGSDFFLG